MSGTLDVMLLKKELVETLQVLGETRESLRVMGALMLELDDIMRHRLDQETFELVQDDIKDFADKQETIFTELEYEKEKYDE